MAPNGQPHWNAKARQSTAGGSRKKGKRKLRPPETPDQDDSNATIVVPKSKLEKDVERKEKMRLEMIAASQTKMTSKKRKRMDNYINMKLKKENRVLILEKLSQTQKALPSTIRLQSSSSLGSRKILTFEDRLANAEHLEVRKRLDGQAGRKRRRLEADTISIQRGEETEEDISTTGDGSDEEWHGIAPASVKPLRPPEPELPSQAVGPSQTSKPSEVGSALRRGVDGSAVTPIVVNRRHKRGIARFSQAAGSTGEARSNSSGFDSSDSDDSSSAGSSSEEDGGEVGSEQLTSSEKRTGFKDWALSQISRIQGHTSMPSVIETAQFVPTPRPRRAEPADGLLRGPLGEELVLPSTTFSKHVQQQHSAGFKHTVVSVTRPPDVQASRLLLPIVSEEQPIVEAILLNPVVIVCGETGSGKTTQVPQFLYEAGFGSPRSDNPGMIGITQPRRVAAISMATRVAHELSLPPSRVSYQIRYDATTAPTTMIKFLTDGVLLREMTTDFLLTRYSVIIIDEAHERSMNTDILIGLLSRAIKLREEMWKEGKAGIKPLRLIIMSATLRVADFAENATLFPTPPPVINISSRQHPVTIHFSRRTPTDYVKEAIRKAIKIHCRLPAGGILIFLTGQNEITSACKGLGSRFSRQVIAEKSKHRVGSKTISTVGSDGDNTGAKHACPREGPVEVEDMDLGVTADPTNDIDDDMGVDGDLEALDSDDDNNQDDFLSDLDDSEVPMHIVPLYSLLAADKQLKAFQAPPSDSRLVVVATNVAETSVTIPGVRYVVDCGRAKERRYDPSSGIQTFQVSWISKASAAQRAGRAGRTGPGHCYRLYSSPLFENHFPSFAEPELFRVPIDGVVLQMKSMHIDAVVNFPFPTPPDRRALKKAEATLIQLEALLPSPVPNASSSITDMGRTMSLFPLSPRFSKMLVISHQHGCLPYVVAIVAGLSVGDPFLREDGLVAEDSDSGEVNDAMTQEVEHIRSSELRAKEGHKARRREFFKLQRTHTALGDGTSDVFRLLSVIGAYEYAGGGVLFCAENFVRPKAMEEIHKLRSQITAIVQATVPNASVSFDPQLLPPSALQCKILRQILAAGFIDQVAARSDIADPSCATGTKFASSRGVVYRALGVAEDVYIHPSSVLFHSTPPDFIVFQEVVRTNRVWIKNLTAVNPSWLPQLGPSLCTYSKPLKTVPASLKGKQGDVVIPQFGPGKWPLPPIIKPSP